VVRDCTIAGRKVEAGKKVYLNIQSANHDEQRWGDDSLDYDMKRSNVLNHLAFGRGIHACIGAPLARIEARAAIDGLMDAYPLMTLAPDAQWTNAPGMLVRRIRSVPVLLTGAAS
jgi:cytochrome P450